VLKGGLVTSPTGTQAIAAATLDPSTEQIITTGGSVILVGGGATGGATSPTNDVSARIVNGGDITFNIGGSGTVAVTSRVGTSHTAPAGLVVIGGGGSGLFGADNKEIVLGDEIEARFTGGGGFSRLVDARLGTSAVVANSPRSYESLLGYIIFAANEETRAARIRAGLTADDSSLPSCN
jgi:hypothetical protein